MSVGIHPRISHLLPSPSASCSRRQIALPPPGVALAKQPRPFSQEAALLASGLTTPPVEDMSTTYHPALSAYDGHAMHSYPSSLAQAGRAKSAAVNAHDSRSAQQYYRYPTQQASQTQTQLVASSQPHVNSFPTAQMVPSSRPSTRPPTRPSTPTAETMAAAVDGTTSRRGSETLIYHSLQIPKCISPNGGNLAEFAAQMTCLFWFESVDELKAAETIHTRSATAPIPRLPALARPYEQFRKWVYSVLSTTQVTQNVIILALLFIYRLKMSTPQIKGRAGSEYRLLTVALMLGNKFLDDNTYTNKTWAEVSCFAVQEIHVMEVEFLSNMRYNLLASKDEWEDWLDKLNCFHEYYERALKLPASPVHMTSPSHKSFHSPMPSPTATALSGAPQMPPFAPSGLNFSPSSSNSQNWSAYQANAVSPLAAKPAMSLPVSRKRSPEEDPTEHPAKRHMPPRLGQLPNAPMNSRPNGPVESARLPVPHLTLVTNHHQQQQQQQQQQKLPVSYSTPTSYTPQSAGPIQNVVALPPLQHGVRAMASVFPPSANMAQQPAMPAMPVATSVAMPNAFPPTALPSHPPMNFGTPTKRHSPGQLARFGSSPMTEHLVSASAVHTPLAHTPISNSPSFYLQQRASPYKPIRHVNRLLYPPPSASLDQYHLAVPVPPNQMHYQPLGRRNDLRTGVVPEFVVYNRGQNPTMPSQNGMQGHQGHYQS